MPALAIENVSRRFGEIAALDGVDLAVPEGELCVVVGPSGCGKSTLLRVVAGLEPADAGRVRIGEEDVTALPPRARDVAFVFQSYALYPHLTVRGNLEFPLRLRGVPADGRERQVRAAAELLGIADLLDRKPAALSGGQRQRVAIGRAVVRRPRLFLFDEPLSNLDAQLRAGMRLELVDLHRRLGTTSLYVTHDQAEAMTLGERVVVMKDGRVRQAGPPREIYDRPADEFVAGFVGNPPMTFLPQPDGTTLGVRPEDFSAAPDGPLAVRVRVVEDFGADRYVHGDSAGAPVVYRLPPDAPAPRPGDTLQLAVRAGKEHRFRNGRRLG